MNRSYKLLLLSAVFMLCLNFSNTFAQSSKHKTFHVIAFYHEYNDLAHISFVHDANKFFPEMAKKYNFTYDSTKDWTKLNAEFLSKYEVVLFLDSRTEDPAQRKAFEEYMKKMEVAGWDFIFCWICLNFLRNIMLTGTGITMCFWDRGST